MSASTAEKSTAAPKATTADPPAPPAPTPIRPKQAKFDGLEITTYTVNLSGKVKLNPENPNDRALIDMLMAGKIVTFPVDAYVAAKAGKAPRDSEGSIKDVNHVYSLTIDSIATADAELVGSA